MFASFSPPVCRQSAHRTRSKFVCSPTPRPPKSYYRLAPADGPRAVDRSGGSDAEPGSLASASRSRSCSEAADGQTTTVVAIVPIPSPSARVNGGAVAAADAKDAADGEDDEVPAAPPLNKGLRNLLFVALAIFGGFMVRLRARACCQDVASLFACTEPANYTCCLIIYIYVYIFHSPATSLALVCARCALQGGSWFPILIVAQSGDDGLSTYPSFLFVAVGSNITVLVIAMVFQALREPAVRWKAIVEMPVANHIGLIGVGAIVHTGNLFVQFPGAYIGSPCCFQRKKGDVTKRLNWFGRLIPPRIGMSAGCHARCEVTTMMLQL